MVNQIKKPLCKDMSKFSRLHRKLLMPVLSNKELLYMFSIKASKFKTFYNFVR